MNPRVASAIERCTRASLVFDLAQIADNMCAFAAAARVSQIRPLFAMKSFPRPEILELAAAHLDGFDVASPDELAQAPGSGIVSIYDPSHRASASARAIAAATSGQSLGESAAGTSQRRVIISCDSVEAIRTAPLNAELALRISASITGRDPAIGALLEGTGHRMSRFGASTLDEVRALVAAASHRDEQRGIGLHVHHGPVTATSAERFIASAQAAIALLADAGREPAFINLGGAWHGIADHAAAFREIRAALPNVELLVEPGRVYTANAGFAVGRVLSTRELPDRVLSVVELSRVAHLRWSQPELVAPPPRAEARHKVMLVGPTCYEEDVIGEWTVEPAHVAERVVLRNVSGYAVAWNTSFGGVPAADVVLVA